MARIDVVMPKMGESVMEGTVLTWFKKPGEEVEADEALLEIGTDKVDSEIPAPETGTVAEILVPEGETVEVGTVLAVLETEAEVEESASEPSGKPDETAPEAAEEAAGEEPEPAPAEEVPRDTTEVSEAAPEAEPMEPPRGAKEEGGIVEIVMPKMGESVMEGTVLTWFKKPGDEVEEDEALLEIGTDKVDSDIPSPVEGVVQEILVEEGATVEVGTVLATIAGSEVPAEVSRQPDSAPVGRAGGGDSDTRDAAQAAEPSGEPAREPSVPPHAGDGHDVEPGRRGPDGRFYSPLVRSIAREEGISATELARIEGSGRGGRVTKEDVLSFLSKRESAPAGDTVTTAPKESEADTPTVRAPSPTLGRSTEIEDDTRVEVIEMDRMRQVIAEHMPRSLATSAHVTSFAEADVTNLVRLREQSKQAFREREGVKLTYTPFFVKAAVDALRKHPLVNSSVDGDRIIVKKDFHIGIAVAIEKTGLVVPVIQNAGGMNVTGLAHAASDLASRARKKELQPDELQGGTFTVTNVGSLGSIMGTPIINQPQVGILATGAIKKRPVVKEHPDYGDIVVVRSMMYLSLSYDHRIIDGAMGSSFLRSLIENLEAMGPGYDL